MRNRTICVALLLVTVLFVSLFLVVNQPSVPAETITEDKPFFVGVEIGWSANVTECKAEIDKVKNYTNLLVLAHGAIMTDEAALNETCDYAYEAGMYILVYFKKQAKTSYDIPDPNNNWIQPLIWADNAKERYGDQFLGVYLDDEIGGTALDRGLPPIRISSEDSLSFGDAAHAFIEDTTRNNDLFSHFGQQLDISLFISDYGLHWFDYKAGYDVVLAEFTKNNSRPLAVALCRGAAKLQNKDWGIMITWEYETPPFLESADELYEDLVFAYNSGAKYVAVYDAWSKQLTNSTLTEDRLDALKNFWEYVQQNPDKHGSLKAETALVLPENYGFGFRNPCDTIWGYNAADMWTQKMYDDVFGLLDEYGSSLDIVYSDPVFNDNLVDSYSEVLTWTPGAGANMYPVVNLNTGMGYPTIQEAINSFATDRGHTILVKAGVYHENLYVNKPVTLMGEDRKTTIIDGGNNGTAVTITGGGDEILLGTFEVADVNLTGFTIRNGDYSLVENASSVPLLASGINLIRASNCSVIGNDIVGNEVGVCLNFSGNNLFRDNYIANNAVNFGVSGNSLSEYVNDIDSSNTIDGKPVIYWVNQQNRTVPVDAGYVALINCTDITAQNLQLTKNLNGLLIAYTQNSTIKDNTFANNWEGINLVYSSGNVLSGNTMQNNRYPFLLTSLAANKIDDTNTVDGKPIIYWVDQHKKTVPSDACYVALINCTEITVQNLQLNNNGLGIFLINTRDTIITQNTITNQSSGIELVASSNNTITNNFIGRNVNYGINVMSSCDNLFAGNTITDNSVGIYFVESSNNIIYRNNITANYHALRFHNGLTANSTYNTVTENNIAMNENHVNLESAASYNTFYHNNFINNTEQDIDYSDDIPYYPGTLHDLITSWDDGSEGNYWSDYTTKFPNATELDNSGVWNTPYPIKSMTYYYIAIIGTDNYPLVEPFPIPSFQYP